MPRPVPNTYGPFTRGIITAIAASLLGAEGCVSASCVDLTDGTLRGSYGPGDAVTTLSASRKFAHYAGNNGWISSENADMGLDVAPVPRSTTYPDGLGVTFYTDLYPGQAPDPLRVQYGASNSTAGLSTPENPYSVNTGVAATTAINRRYKAVATKADPFGLEGNPTDAILVNSANKHTLWVNTNPGTGLDWYATENGDPDGAFYYLGPGQGFEDDATAIDDTRPLDWGLGGNVNNAAMPYDHSQPPAATVLADSMFSVTDSADDGILFAAAFEIVRWSANGQPHYFPEVHQHTLPEPVEALVVHGPQALAFTVSGIWGFSGSADYAIQPAKTASNMGVRSGFGRTVVATPFGVLFVAREGLALFDGATARIITSGVLNPSDFSGYDYATAAFYDNSYFLSLYGSGELWRFDLRDFPNMRVTKEEHDVSAFHVTTKTDSPGLYIVERTTGAVKPWRPADESQGGDIARQAWSYKTGDNACGDQAREKRFLRVNARGAGTLQLKFYVNGSATAAFTKTGAGLFWLPPGIRGRTLSWEAISSDGTGVLYSVDIQTEVADGA